MDKPIPHTTYIAQSGMRIRFPQVSEHVHLSRTLPADAAYRMRFASCRHWQHEQFRVVEQYYASINIFLHLLEIKCMDDLFIDLTGQYGDLYFLYQLEGKLRLTVAAKKKISAIQIKAHHYRAAYLPAGDHGAYFKKGTRTLLFYFVVRQDLLLQIGPTSLSFMKKLLHQMVYKPHHPGTSTSLPLLSKTRLHIHRIIHLPRYETLALEEHIPAMVFRLIALAREACEEENTAMGKSMQQLEQIRQLVQENIAESIAFSITELAEDFQMSPDYLRTVHKKFYHESLQRFITHSRLMEGKRQLEEGRHPTEVALDLLYYDGSAFNRAFKKEFGLTPSVLYEQARPKPAGGQGPIKP